MSEIEKIKNEIITIEFILKDLENVIIDSKMNFNSYELKGIDQMSTKSGKTLYFGMVEKKECLKKGIEIEKSINQESNIVNWFNTSISTFSNLEGNANKKQIKCFGIQNVKYQKEGSLWLGATKANRIDYNSVQRYALNLDSINIDSYFTFLKCLDIEAKSNLFLDIAIKNTYKGIAVK